MAKSILQCVSLNKKVVVILLFLSALGLMIGNAQSIQVANGSPCVGSTITFVLNGFNCSGYTWSVSGGTILSGQNTQSIQASWSSANTYQVGVFASCNGGSSTNYTTSITISSNTAPTTANAGPDQGGSATCGLSSVTMAGNTPSVGTGSWSVISGSGGSFGNSASPTSSFTGVGAYTLRWTITNTVCTNPSLDDVNITINRNPTPANAGADQNLCGATSTTLAANAPSVGSGSWSVISGAGGSFGNSASASSTFSGTAGTTYTLRWTTSNSPCSSSIDDVIITFTARNTYTVQMNAPSEICAGTTTITPVVTVAGQYGNLTYRWFINGSPQAGGNSFVVTATPGTTIYCEVTSDGCANSPVNTSPVYTIPAITSPTPANAGADQTGSTTCGLTSVSLNGNAPSSGSGSWSIISGAGGSIVTPSSPSSVFNGTAGTAYVLRWTITVSSCPSSSDDVNITFNRLPTTANAGPDQTSSATCGLTSVVLAANTPAVGVL